MIDPPPPSRAARLGQRSFFSFVATQFLGAFNDNIFKQTVLLMAVRQMGKADGDALQPIAAALFALPFILFSGFAGLLADRYSKTTIIVRAKLAEIAVMILAGVGFYFENMTFLLVVVFLMGTQSAFFGPAKYGCLPEMIKPEQISRANGIVLMTTFVAIITGQALAGVLLTAFDGQLETPSAVYIAIAALGTWTALGIKRLPPARPDIALRGRPFGNLWSSIAHIYRDRALFWVMLAYCHFWFLGGVMQPYLNMYGTKFMKLDEGSTSLLLASLSGGIAAGALSAAMLSRRSVDFRLSVTGVVGICMSLTALAFAHENLAVMHAVLWLLGGSAGLFSVPLQAFIQLRAPEGKKGRIVAATNFLTWIAIFLSALYYGVATMITRVQGAPWIAISLVVLTVSFAGLFALKRPLVGARV